MDQLVRLNDRRAGLGPPRFRLGTLLLIVTAICIVLATYRWLGPYGATLIGLFALAILAHVAGNWLGTQLRDIGDRASPDDELANAPITHGLAKGSLQPQHFAPATHLRARAPLPRAVLITVVTAFALGALGGALLVWLLSPKFPTWAMFVCGAAAFGALAAMGAFLIAAFVQSGWKALSQATKE